VAGAPIITTAIVPGVGEMNQQLEIIALNDVALAENAAVPFEKVPPPAEMDFDARVEAIAVEIELVQATALLRVAGLVAKAHQMFLYQRDEGGFTGWVESRLNFSERTAYRLLDVHEKFGQESSPIWQTFPRSILYLLAAPSTPQAARDAVNDAAADGGRLTHAQVKEMIAEAREAERPAIEAELARLRQDAELREAAVRAEYAGKLFVEPAELEAEVAAEIAKARQPLQRRAEDLQKKLDDMKERERKRRAEEAEQAEKKRGIDADLEHPKKPQKDPTDETLSLLATVFGRGLIDLTETMMKITPAELIEVSNQKADATDQTLPQFLSDSPQRARTAISWLNSFIEQFERRQ
jgi:hypothetical protein